MIKSFRTRLIWLSVVVSGLALMAFGAGSWWLIRGIQIERLDAEVRAHAEREVGRLRSAFAWQRFEADVLTNFGLRQSRDLLLLAQDAAGQELYRSPHWPSSFDTARMPWPSQQDVPQPGPWIQLLRPPPPDGPRGLPREGQWGPPTDAPSGLPHDAERSRIDMPPGVAEDRPPTGPRPASKVIFRNIAGQPWRIGLASTERAHVLIAVNAAVIDGEMTSVRNAFLVAIPLALLMIGAGAWVLSSRALRPLKKLSEATRQVTAKGLDQRLSSMGEDLEFAELIGVFNSMLERLERSFQQANRFSADAAHELKTPLAILQGQLERAIQQADAGRMRIFKAPFDLTSALQDVMEDTQMLAPHLKITSTIDASLTMAADSSLIRQVLHNLISNAIKYNLPEGWIHLATHKLENRIEVCVSNASAGISAADEGKLFDRFYRADTAHSRQVEGVGLGLSLSREIARAHGGDLTLKTQSGQAVEFVLLLPLA